MFEKPTDWFAGICNIGAGKGDNLDLNLWISPTSSAPQETDNSKIPDLHFATSELHDGKRLKVFCLWNDRWLHPFLSFMLSLWC